MNCEAAIDWDDLYSDLKNEKAILILGPEFYANHGTSVKKLLCEELKKKDDHGVEHFYPDDGIFLFNSARYKSKAQRAAARFYESLPGDRDLLQKITELPFRTIINTNPDKKLQEAYYKNGVECQFDFFMARSKKKIKELVEPDRHFPLIFNLFGSIDEQESLVLDFEDIFDHLKKLLNDINVADVIRTVLNETETYIFIGFRLEKWYTQLLFRYLNMKEFPFDDRKKNYTVKSSNIDTDCESFFRQQFNIKYYGIPIEFLNTIHRKYVEMAVAEDMEMANAQSPWEFVEHCIASDEIQKALNLLTLHINKEDSDLSNELILIKSNFARYNYLHTRKLEDPGPLEIQRNKVKQSILEIVKHIQN